MGGCTNSKYAVDEDKKPKKEKKPLINIKRNKKDKKDANAVSLDAPVANGHTTPVANGDATHHDTPTTPRSSPTKVEKEDIEFIDKDDVAAAARVHTSSETTKSDQDDTKKEVTTYQTTVVKHTQKEGDELMQHLRDEAFRTLQSLLKQQKQQHETTTDESNSTTTTTTRTTTAHTSSGTPETATSDSNEDIVEQIKSQVLDAVGKTRSDFVNELVESGAQLIRDGKVSSMNELQVALEDTHPGDGNPELIKKVINATAGFLTAKGTEAGALLSNILANVDNGIQGVMNEVEKTTVKVTRTVTEQIMTSNGQLKEVTRVITSTVDSAAAVPQLSVSSNQPADNIDQVLKNLSNGIGVDGTPFETVTEHGTKTVSTTSHTNETHHQTVADSEDETMTKQRAHDVVEKAVSAAVERVLIDEDSTKKYQAPLLHTNGHHYDESFGGEVMGQNIKVEEESTVKTSTTKIVLNGDEPTTAISNKLEQVQSEFYKHGKQAAEEATKKVSTEALDREDAELSQQDEEESDEQQQRATNEIKNVHAVSEVTAN